MKKNLAVGLFAIALIAAGGTGAYIANAKETTQDPIYFMQQKGMGQSQMTQMMNSSNSDQTQQLKQGQKSTFEQMLPYMKKMHPNLSDEQLKSLYESMHGPNGACDNAQDMMENTNDNL